MVFIAFDIQRLKRNRAVQPSDPIGIQRHSIKNINDINIIQAGEEQPSLLIQRHSFQEVIPNVGLDSP